MDLLAKIKNLNFIVGYNINNLNAGGCGIFCYMMYNKLKDLGIECKVVGLDLHNVRYKKSNVIKQLNNEEHDGELACSHYVIEIKKGFLFDGYYVYDSYKEVDYGEAEYFTIEELKVALDYGRWNPCYKRTQNESLAKIIEDVFETKVAA
jgi:hypothetical protein